MEQPPETREALESLRNAEMRVDMIALEIAILEALESGADMDELKKVVAEKMSEERLDTADCPVLV